MFLFEKQKSFTLLELLVVITIIGILTSIVVVSMSGSTDSATIAKGKAYAQQVHALLGANAVGIWNFDEGVNNTCYDVSGYNNNGTIYGADYTLSPIDGYALNFNGSSDYVLVNDLTYNNVAEWSLSVWGKKTSYVQYQSLYSDYNSSQRNIICGYESSEGIMTFYTGSGGSTIATNMANVWTTDEWIHWVFVFKGGEHIRIYKNSIMIKERIDNIPVSIAATHTSRYFGRYSSIYFSGLIDEARIYTEALSTTEIQKHYVQGLNKLLANQAITQTEYNQRMEELNQSLVSNL